jgi:hypothetical protein
MNQFPTYEEYLIEAKVDPVAVEMNTAVRNIMKDNFNLESKGQNGVDVLYYKPDVEIKKIADIFEKEFKVYFKIKTDTEYRTDMFDDLCLRIYIVDVHSLWNGYLCIKFDFSTRIRKSKSLSQIKK